MAAATPRRQLNWRGFAREKCCSRNTIPNTFSRYCNLSSSAFSCSIVKVQLLMSVRERLVLQPAIRKERVGMVNHQAHNPTLKKKREMPKTHFILFFSEFPDAIVVPLRRGLALSRAHIGAVVAMATEPRKPRGMKDHHSHSPSRETRREERRGGNAIKIANYFPSPTEIAS